MKASKHINGTLALVALWHSTSYSPLPPALTTPAHVSIPTSGTAKEFDEALFNWLRTFAEILNYTQQKHYKVSHFTKSMTNAMDAFLTTLDPHSSFLDPDTYKNILESTSGEFFGIGVIIDNTRQAKDKALAVIDIIPEGPADKAGLRPGDKIIEINGEALEGMSTDKATAKLKGERNTQVHVKVLRDNQQESIPFDITRDVIKEQNSLCFYVPEHNIYYLSLNMFTETAAKQLEQLLQKSTQQKAKALILDLRNNTGGLLDAAINIVGLFVDKGSVVVTTKNKEDKETERYKTKTNPIAHTNVPIFILINNYTASAAEILAGCLKIHSEDQAKKAKKREQKKLMVFLVGTRTFGKGSVQEVIPVSNNCAAKITTSLYYLPDNTTIQGIGIEPDFELERRLPPSDHTQWVTKFYGRESSLSNYIQTTTTLPSQSCIPTPATKKPNEKTWLEKSKEHLQTDNQFRHTISLANLFDTAKKCCPEKVNNRTNAIQFMKSVFSAADVLTLVEVKS